MGEMTDDDTRERARDVLAAEEFEMGAADPALHRESPHDVLAAEEFEVGSADPALHRGPLTVPAEPGAGPRPHDVLAADEFPVPAGPAQSGGSGRRTMPNPGRRGLLGLAAAAAVLVVARRRRP